MAFFQLVRLDALVLVALFGLVLGAAPRAARPAALFAFSVAALAWWANLRSAAALLAYAAALYAAVHMPGPRGISRALTLLAFAALIVIPVIALGEVVGLSAGAGSVPVEIVAYGTNTAFLRWWSYWRDVERGGHRAPFVRYGAWSLFFPLFMAGPIERERDFRDRERAPGSPGSFWDRAERAIAKWLRHPALVAGAVGAARIAVGYAKVQVALRFVPQSLEVFAGFEAMDRLALWLWAARLWVNFYLVFSGWIDVALGLSRWLGFRPQENFRAPWLATSVADFWRRWHVSFGAWLREYVYLPLGGNRRGNVHVTIQIVFLMSALWHVWGGHKLGVPIGHVWNYVLWGALNGLGVSAAKIWQGRRARGAVPVLPLPAPVRRALCAAATFLYVSLTWIPFYTPPTVPLRRFLNLIARMFGLD